jgi:acetyl-CoA acetyltransferase
MQIVGTGTSQFGMFVDVRLRSLVTTAVRGALADARVTADDIGFVFFGNAAAGLLTGQEMIRAQTSLADSPLAGRPTLSVENACASSSSAFHVACMAIESGMHHCVAVVGAEKMTSADRTLAGRVLATGVDVDAEPAVHAGSSAGDAPRPVFMEIYAAEARAYMERSGATARDLAEVAAKSTRNGSHNPIAQVRQVLTADEVLASREIVSPLTRPMCAGIGDGAAAVILCSEDFARQRGLSGPRVAASVLTSNAPALGAAVVEHTARLAFDKAGIGPADLDVVELHDAASPAELIISEELGLVPDGEGPRLVRDGTSDIGGRCPINPSGGLTARGHPIGATGVAQLVELTDQLRGRAGARQAGSPRFALAENAGGSMYGGPAACAITILEA